MAVLLVLFSLGMTALGAGDVITREYWLKNTETPDVITTLNFSLGNPTGKRLMGGQGKHLVVTDTDDQQEAIAELLPVIDLPNKETTPPRIKMEMALRAARYLQKKKKTATASAKGGASPLAASPAGPHADSFDAYKSTRSVYAAEDAALVKDPRVILDEGGLPSLSDLTLKGVFKSAKGTPLALLTYGTVNYTARDGGLYERNQSRVNDVKSQVFDDKVILIGPDRIPRKITFKSTL